jgi:signal transduction histidine kinase
VAVLGLTDLVALVALHGAAYRQAVAVFSLLVIGTAAAALVPFVRKLAQQRITDFIVLGLAAVLTICIGGYDWLVVSGFLPFEMPFALPYVWPILLSAFAWVIAGDYAATQRDLATLNRELADRVRAREAALLETHEQLRRAERSQAHAEERARILRDMHDGVGSHLVTALRQLESDRPSKAEVANTLRDSLDHLKLSIDGMSVVPGDVNATLAMLRYRLTPRLEAAGLHVEWNVEDLPLWQAGHADGAMRHLQFLLFEIVSNVLQHARASTLRFSATGADECIRIVIEDDGCGIPQDVSPRSCETRSQAIGATLEIVRLPRGTRIGIVLPGAA